MTILIFFLVLFVLIVTHELGHFAVAKFFKIRVDEFGLGLPPKLFGKKFGETLYSLNLLPFGGFVKIYGEAQTDDASASPDFAQSLVSKPKSVQALVLVGGVVCNLLLAWFLLSLGFMIGLPVSGEAISGGESSAERLLIVGILPDSPAHLAGLLAGDEVLKLESGSKIIEPKVPTEMITFIDEVGLNEINLEIKRGEEILLKTVTPIDEAPADEIIAPIIGVSLDQVKIVSLSFFRAIIEGFKYTAKISWLMVVTLAQLLGELFQGESVANALVGPVGLVGMVGDASEMGLVYLLTFTALISINLAIFNLLPFPALDGGRLLIVLIEAIKGSPIKAKIVNGINAFGFLILIGLMILLTYNDIARLF